MKPFLLRTLLLILALGTISLACMSSATPEPAVPVPQDLTMETACEYDNQVVELEGQLVLPRGLSCTTTDNKETCSLTFYDPLRVLSMMVDIPVSTNSSELPVNSMAALPDEFQTSDFLVRTTDNRYARDGSFITIRGEVDSSYGNLSCNLVNIESIRLLDRLVYKGIEITRLPLQQALTEGLIEVEITGNGLTQITLKIKPKVDVNLEIEMQPGTMFISGTEGVQNMVLRQMEIIYLQPQVEVSLDLEVSCANMYLTQPGYADTFTISTDPVNEDLVRLLAVEDFPFNHVELQQFAIWTITDNPATTYDYIGIESGGYTQRPGETEIEIMRTLFEEAGIDTAKYLIFNN